MTPPDYRASPEACDADTQCLHVPCFQVQLDGARPRQAHQRANACAYHVADIIETLRRWAAEIAQVLRRYPSTGVIEDDHAGPVAGVPGFTSCAGLARWVTLRSVSKSLGPDLRLAVVAGDEATITRVAGRQALGTGWVSYQLQEMVADLWSDATAARTLAEAARVYAGRGGALRSALAAHGITASGRSGFTCWVSVADEDGVAAALAQGGDLPVSAVPGGDPAVSPRAGMAAAGWAVAPGRRFRIAAPPGVRICFARRAEPDAPAFAAEFARALRHRASRLD